MDFIQMPVSQGYKYPLVMINTFTAWIEDLPTGTEKAVKVKVTQWCPTFCHPMDCLWNSPG